MKRGSTDSPQLQNSKLKYKLLLEDYLVLQKGYVSKKRKLQVQKQKREILLHEVRFLRQRHRYLTKLQHAKVKPELGPCQNLDIHDVSIKKEIHYGANETNTKQESNGREEHVWKKESIIKKPVNFINSTAKKTGKKKVTWQDEVSLMG